jgi:S-(hydroxymethyl)glutathione dehydrogenase / alcohol dehydrogenase
LEYAKQFGATHTVNPSKQELHKTVRSLTEGRGADYAFEVIGLGKTIEQAYACTRQGGTTIVVGAPSREDTVTIPASSLLVEKCIKGSLYGSARPRVDMPRLIDLYMNKKLKIDELVSRTYSLDEVNVALDALAKGEVARSVVVM